MLGAALEAQLLGMVHWFPQEASRSLAFPKQKGSPKDLLTWDLGQLLAVSKELGWLRSGLLLDEEWSSRRARIGDYADVLRQIRNLIHTGRFVRDHSPSRVTDGQVFPPTGPLGHANAGSAVVIRQKAAGLTWGSTWGSDLYIWGWRDPRRSSRSMPRNPISSSGDYLMSHWVAATGASATPAGVVRAFLGRPSGFTPRRTILFWLSSRPFYFRA